MPPVHVRPPMQWFIGWHIHPSDPAVHSVVSTMPEAPSGIWHIPFLQTPLAQSGPVMHEVFGRGTVGMQYQPVHLALWQSLAWVQCEPAGEPVLAPPPEPPLEVEPPAEVEASSDVEPPAPEVET